MLSALRVTEPLEPPGLRQSPRPSSTPPEGTGQTFSFWAGLPRGSAPFPPPTALT